MSETFHDVLFCVATCHYLPKPTALGWLRVDEACA